MLDRARLPGGPTSPNRPMINLIGALAGLGVGLGLVALLEYRDNGLRSEDDVVSVLSLPVLAAIPVIETRRGSPPRSAGSACLASSARQRRRGRLGRRRAPSRGRPAGFHRPLMFR